MKINNCPFCGGKVIATNILEDDEEYYILECQNEMCNSAVSFGYTSEDMEEAIQHYNRRTAAVFNQTGNNNTQITNAGTLNLNL